MTENKYVCNIYTTLSGNNKDEIKELLADLNSALSRSGYALAYNPDEMSGVIIKMGDSND